MHQPARTLAVTAALLVLPASASASARDRAAADAVMDWNAAALATTRQAPFNPPRETRSMAIVQAAVLDAVSSITHGRAPYLVRVRAAQGASLPAAVAGAAHASLAALYPEQREALDARYAEALAALPPGRSRDDGAAAGEAVGGAVVALRAHDGSDASVRFTPGSGPGEWVPTPPAFAPALEPGWGEVTPFLLRSAADVRPGPPPAPGSRRAERDLLEIRFLGSANSPLRTPEQTGAARFWVATAPQLWNQAVQRLARSHDLGPTRTAKAFAALNLAGADAFIAAWNAKFAYRQWRPVTAIRATVDPDWTPLLATPPFPDYPAAHTTYAGAAETVLRRAFGAAPGPFIIVSATADGAAHRFTGFRDVADEVEGARVWGGVHWRTSSHVGREVGRRVGELALESIDPR